MNKNSPDYYDEIKQRFRKERDVRIEHRPEGRKQYTTDLAPELDQYAIDPQSEIGAARRPLNDRVEVLCIGGGFSALLAAVRLREKGVASIRIVERGADVGGTWYWNRYPGVACDVLSYDYLPLLDEMAYVPERRYSSGEEILGHCQAIARRFDLYDCALFSTTVTATTWIDDRKVWKVETDRGDCIEAQFVICANGTMSQPKIPNIPGIEAFKGHSFHTARWDYGYTGTSLENLKDKRVGIIGTGASAVQIVPELARSARELFVIQRTPSSIDVREEGPTDPEWAKSLKPGWQAKRREEAIALSELSWVERMTRAQEDGVNAAVKAAQQSLDVAEFNKLSREERIKRQEAANIDHMMSVHKRIDDVVRDRQTAEALKPWYMFMCKRPCIHNEYLPAFNAPNVHLIDTKGIGVNAIVPEGPVVDGQVLALDLLIYATGFDVQKTGTYNRITGIAGLELSEKYKDGISTLFGIHSRGFPNLFIMGGLQASYQFNITDMLQTQGDHIAECIAFARENGHGSIEPTADAEAMWVKKVIDNRGKTSWSEECTPGYYNFEGESNRRQDGNYNGTFRSYVDSMKEAQSQMSDYFTFSNGQ